MADPIFMIASIYSGYGLNDPFVSSRTWGWYPTEADARDAVSCNDGDMHEMMYDYIVIEKVPFGGMPINEAVQWCHWEHGKWTPCDKPKFAEGMMNFTLG